MRKKALLISCVVLAAIALAVILKEGLSTKLDVKGLIFNGRPRKITIQELSPSHPADVFNLEEMSGHWVFFIHFRDRTKTVDMVLDKRGDVVKSTDPVIMGATFEIDKKGNIHASALNMRLTGVMETNGSYIRGIISEKSMRGPIWFSACKIS